MSWRDHWRCSLHRVPPKIIVILSLTGTVLNNKPLEAAPVCHALRVEHHHVPLSGSLPDQASLVYLSVYSRCVVSDHPHPKLRPLIVLTVAVGEVFHHMGCLQIVVVVVIMIFRPFCTRPSTFSWVNSLLCSWFSILHCLLTAKTVSFQAGANQLLEYSPEDCPTILDSIGKSSLVHFILLIKFCV